MGVFVFLLTALNVEMQYICHEIELPLMMVKANCVYAVLIANKTEKQTFEIFQKPRSRNLANDRSVRTYMDLS